MSFGTNIGWCHATINFWWGCREVSPACRLCYARKWAAYTSKRLFGFKILWGRGKQRGERLKAAREAALALDRKAQKKGVRYRVFANSMSDWLDDEVPAEWLASMLETIHLTPHLDWLLLTKRPENFRDRVFAAASGICGNREDCGLIALWFDQWLADGFGRTIKPPSNVWVGVTVENQEWADKRIPQLLKIPAAIRFLSLEPLLGQVELLANVSQRGAHYKSLSGRDWLQEAIYCKECNGSGFYRGTASGCRRCSGSGIDRVEIKIHWGIIGGESGKGKGSATPHPMHVDWARHLVAQFRAADTPVFFKQWGEWIHESQGDPREFAKATSGRYKPHHWPDGTLSYRIGKEASGEMLDGHLIQEFPASMPQPPVPESPTLNLAS